MRQIEFAFILAGDVADYGYGGTAYAAVRNAGTDVPDNGTQGEYQPCETPEWLASEDFTAYECATCYDANGETFGTLYKVREN